MVIILENLITYKNKVINIKTGLITIDIKGKMITMNFDILLLGNDKVVLGMP